MMFFAEPTNEDRANRVPPALEAYEKARGFPPDEAPDLADLLTDLMHYAKREGHNFQTLLTVAEVNYREECEEAR